MKTMQVATLGYSLYMTEGSSILRGCLAINNLVTSSMSIGMV